MRSKGRPGSIVNISSGEDAAKVIPRDGCGLRNGVKLLRCSNIDRHPRFINFVAQQRDPCLWAVEQRRPTLLFSAGLLVSTYHMQNSGLSFGRQLSVL